MTKMQKYDDLSFITNKRWF